MDIISSLKKASLMMIALSVLHNSFSQTERSSKINYIAPVYRQVDLGEIKPQGWLRDQLQIMADNSTGHLDEYYAKIKNDNGWLGGKGDGWEETPYWLDGATPLAYLLDDKRLQEKVSKYIDWAINNQRPSGYFGPLTKYERESGEKITLATAEQGEDWWPKMIMLKVIQQYYAATRDKRVIPFMLKYFNYQRSALKRAPLNKWTDWAKSRGSENMLVAQWLYGITQNKMLLELAEEIQQQALPWSRLLGNRDWVINAASLQNKKDWMTRHGVNVGMAVKEPALNYQRTSDKKYLQYLNTGWKDLMTLHGLANGIFSADEDLHGNLPTQGTELCATVEAMFSMEEILAITGDLSYADALERMTFNALPPQTTDNFNEKQYFQIANQVEVNRGVYDFSLPFDRQMNNVYGMRSGYTCCLANMHQGWAKFSQNLWFKTKNNGLAALVYAPNFLSTSINGQKIEIEETGSYPFEDEITFTIHTARPVYFPLECRIPIWCQNPNVQMKDGAFQKLEKKDGKYIMYKTWKDGDRITIRFPMQVIASNWGRNSRTIERGPLVYGLKLKEIFSKGLEPREGDYFTVATDEPWNYGLLKDWVDHPEKMKVEYRPLKQKFIWNQEHAPLEISAIGKRIPSWTFKSGQVASQPVTDREGIYKGRIEDTIEKITLIPYGFTKLRIVSFPVVN